MKKAKFTKRNIVTRDPYFTNNYRKLHGMPMRRIVHLEKLAKQRERRMIMDYIRHDIETLNAVKKAIFRGRETWI